MPHPDAKTALALALRDALSTTPLSKVTVSGLTRTAGVTRQAFYYHFSDIRDLTVWVFKREVGNQVGTHSSYDEWSDGLLAMLVWMQSHPEETRSVISSLGMEELQLFLHKPVSYTHLRRGSHRTLRDRVYDQGDHRPHSPGA